MCGGERKSAEETGAWRRVDLVVASFLSLFFAVFLRFSSYLAPAFLTSFCPLFFSLFRCIVSLSSCSLLSFFLSFFLLILSLVSFFDFPFAAWGSC